MGWQGLYAGEIPTCVSTAEDQEDLAITIYNANFALVKDIRLLTLPAGAAELQFEDVASSIDPTSVHYKALLDPKAVTILEQNYVFDLITPRNLMEKYLGKRLKLVVYHDEQEREVEATLISTQDGYTYKIGDEIHINYPGRVVLSELPENLWARPTLIWLLNSRTADSVMSEVSYLTDNINWKADYVAVGDQEDAFLDLTGWVTITNQSGNTYRNAGVKLIAGDVHRVSPPRVARRKEMALYAADEREGRPFEERACFEYHLYTLGRRTTIRDRETKQLTLLSASHVPAKKLFEYEARAYTRLNPIEAEGKKKVRVMLEVQNSATHHLGMPLPAGKVRVYKADVDESLEFIGEDMIDHTPKDEKVKLLLGNAFDIVGEHVQTDFRQLSRTLYEMDYRIELRNHKEEDVSVSVIEHATEDWTILRSNHPYEKQDAATFSFLVRVPADGKATITYTIRVRT
jgi:hypothetical protein